MENERNKQQQSAYQRGGTRVFNMNCEERDKLSSCELVHYKRLLNPNAPTARQGGPAGGFAGNSKARLPWMS
jgi:hypothetical protein